MKEWTEDEKKLLIKMLVELGMDRYINEWQRKFIHSLTLNHNIILSDMQRIKVLEAVNRTSKYKYKNMIKLLLK